MTRPPWPVSHADEETEQARLDWVNVAFRDVSIDTPSDEFVVVIQEGHGGLGQPVVWPLPPHKCEQDCGRA